jgi:two-component system OmpR family sensor kinase
MGRLFWKFFLVILLAQGLATIGVGATFWLWGRAREAGAGPYGGPPGVDTRSQAAEKLDLVAVAFKFGGMRSLRELITTAQGSNVFIVDASGAELMGRSFDMAMFAEVESKPAHEKWPPSIRKFIAADGTTFSVFVAREKSDFGPRRKGARAFLGAPPVFGSPGKPGPHAATGLDGRPREGHRLPYITMVVAILASLLFAALLAWHTARPIRALRAAFAAAASGDLNARFAAGGNKRGDELFELGREFDRMSLQLRRLMENQQRLLHDVSHELRAPLARLQAALGLAQQQPDKQAEWTRRIERESERMEKLVGELLTLSRLDAATSAPPMEEIAVLELIDEVIADARFEAATQGRSVAVTGCPRVKVRGSPDLLCRAIDNIVRNAIKYSPQGGTVEVDLRAEGMDVQLRVLDRGPGVPAQHLAKIFLPFFRSDSGASHVEGHGLGLAISLRVVEAHGGVIVARNRAGGGLCVTVVLPVSGAA